MSGKSHGLDEALHAYLLEVGVRESAILARLRDETAALPQASMQIAPEQGAFMAFLIEALGARTCLEVGTFTGYSSLTVAMAMPPDGRLVCCDVSDEWTSVARRYWAEAGVADRIELRLGPALATLDALLADGAGESFDFAFLDADKEPYPDYYERILRLLRRGGVLAIDNVFSGGSVVDEKVQNPRIEAIRSLNRRIATDERVTVSMIPIADGLTLVRKR